VGDLASVLGIMLEGVEKLRLSNILVKFGAEFENVDMVALIDVAKVAAAVDAWSPAWADAEEATRPKGADV